MASRIYNIERPPSLIESSRFTLSVPHRYVSIEKAIGAAKKGSTIEVYPGNYAGDFTLKDGVNLIGIGEGVIITGTITVEGTSTIKNLEVISVKFLIDSNLVLSRVSANKVCGSGILRGDHLHLGEVEGTQTGHISLLSSTIKRLLLSEVVSTIDSCTIEDGVKLSGESVIDCRNTTLISQDHDIIEVGPGGLVQLFNCYASGNCRIKSGEGNSYRSNLIALGEATEFIGGVNTRIENI